MTAEGGAGDGTADAMAAWRNPPPGRVLGRGHSAGDFLEAYDWVVLEDEPGHLRLEASLPERVRNPRGQLFGGFTPTYVDLVALLTVRAGHGSSVPGQPAWLATTNMRVDYFEPIVGPTFVIDSRLERRRGRTHLVATRFYQDGELAVFALTTLRLMDVSRSLGDA